MAQFSECCVLHKLMLSQVFPCERVPMLQLDDLLNRFSLKEPPGRSCDWMDHD